MPQFNNDPVVSKDDGAAVIGESTTWMGVFGRSESTTGGHGVMGDAVGTGVVGVSQTWLGVYGESNAPITSGAAGVMGEGKNGSDGVKGVAHGPGKAAVVGFHLAESGTGGAGVHGESRKGPGVVAISQSDMEPALKAITVNNAAVWGQATGTGWAGFFRGNVHVDQRLEAFDVFLLGADCAEEFDTEDLEVAEPGTVMVIGAEGSLRPSALAYDKRVAGIISGAGEYQPGIVLGRREDRPDRARLGLVGKLYCKVDASYGAIDVGDLLTTSTTPGHAMKAADPLRAFGSVIGKALRPLSDGRSLLPVLATLQ
jgi:hypothetical protein